MEAPKWTDIAIVILTGGIVLLAYMQWREMHGAGKQTDDLIKAASVQALAATKNAEAADKFAATAAHMDTKIDATEKDFQQIANRAGESLRNTQESFRNDQRAWVGVSNQTVGVFNPTLFDAQIEFTNSGKTPARNVKRSLTVAVHPQPLLDEPTPDEIKSLILYGASTLAPQARITLRATTVDPNSALVLANIVETDYKAIDSGTLILYAFGEVRYDDVSDKHHLTRYCVYAVKIQKEPPAWGLASCNRFNEMN